MVQGDQPFAVLMMSFTDSASPLPLTQQAVQAAWHKVVNFWASNSFAIISVGNSVVFDWKTMGLTLSDFKAKFTTYDANGNVTDVDRGGMADYAKQQSGIDTSKFVGFIVIFPTDVGTAFTAGNSSIFVPSIVNLDYMCHEMCHILGEGDHSFDDSGRQVPNCDWCKPGEYWDQTDLMSAAHTWGTPAVAGDPFSRTGPNLSMVWRDFFGWLGQGYMRRISTQELSTPFDQTFTLDTREFQSGQGLACVRFGDTYVELARNDMGPDSFDAGLPSSGILIHRREHLTVDGNPTTRSYVTVKDLENAPDQKFWFAGDVYTRDGIGDVEGKFIYLWVKDIDGPSRTATVNVSNTYPSPLTEIEIVAIRKYHSTAAGGFDYIEFVGIRDENGNLQAIVRETVIHWIQSGRNVFYVQDVRGVRALVEVVSHTIQTVPDGETENNLLSLPSF